MFLAKKLLSTLLMPSFSLLALFLIGLILLYCGRIRFAKIGLTIVFILMLVLSFYWTSDILLSPLESKYPPLTTLPKGIQWVVVLGGGSLAINHTPWRELGSASLQRLITGIEIANQLPGSKLVLSGGNYFSPTRNVAVVMRQEAIGLGFPKDRILLDEKSFDTAGEVVHLKPIIQKTPFILVTSAYHMPRAMKLFKKQGMRAIPAPTDYQVVQFKGLIKIPSLNNIDRVDLALHEYLGLVWEKIRGST